MKFSIALFEIWISVDAGNMTPGLFILPQSKRKKNATDEKKKKGVHDYFSSFSTIQNITLQIFSVKQRQK